MHARVGVQQVKIKFYTIGAEENSQRRAGMMGAVSWGLVAAGGGGRRDERSPGGVSRNADTPSLAWKNLRTTFSIWESMRGAP